MRNQQFGALASEGVASVAHRWHKTRAGVLLEMRDALMASGVNVKDSTVAGWCKGFIPKEPELIAWLARYCVRQGRVDRQWAESLLRQARSPERERLLEALFPAAPPSPLSSSAESAPPALPTGKRLVEDLSIPRLSVLTTGLIGREPVLSHLKEQLLAGHHLGMYALQGLPGIGKTALAVTLARDPDILAHFSDGVLWAGLGRQPRLVTVLSRWASLLGLASGDFHQLQSLQDWSAALREAIGARRLLLVIDDAWQAEDALACQVGGPNCAHLLTTRSTGVALPFASQGTVPLAELSTEAGFELLRQLAPHVVTSEPEEAHALVQAVGGLPLGLVLLGQYLHRQAFSRQARRVRDALGQLNQREVRMQVAQPQAPINLHPSFPLRSPLSLQASIGLSVGALSAEAQAMLWALAVFPPKPTSVSEEAALVVTGGKVETLDTLVDAGLVESAGDRRYYLHQTIVDYARLQGVPLGAERWLIGWAVDWIAAHQHDEPALEQELPLLLESLRLAGTRELHTLLIQGTTALAPYLLAHGLYATATDLLQQAKEAALALADSAGLAATWHQLGRLAARRGEYASAVTCYQEGIRLARQQAASPHLSSLLMALGLVYQTQGDLGLAQIALEEGLVLARQEGNQEVLAGVLINLGSVAMRRSDYEHAEIYYQEGWHLAQACHHAERIGAALQGLAHTAAMRGDFSQAEAYVQQGITLARHLGHRIRLCTLLSMLGGLLLDQGRFEQAERTLSESLQCARELGYREGMGSALVNLTEAAFRLGYVLEAEAALQEGLALARQMGHYEYLCGLLRLQGEMALQQGHVTEAEAALEEGLALARARGHYRHQSRLLSGWGQVHLAIRQLEEAEQALTEALKLARELENQELEAIARYGLAQLALERAQLDEAQQQGQESWRLFAALGHYQAAEARQWLAQFPRTSREPDTHQPGKTRAQPLGLARQRPQPESGSPVS